MSTTQKIFVRAILASFVVAAIVFGFLMSFSNKSHFFLIGGSNPLSEAAPEPLAYETIGNYPPLEEGQLSPKQDKEFTLEISSCEDKTCITKTLSSLNQKGIEAFYTPSKNEGKLIFRIRRGIFTSRQSAEKAQATLNKDKKIDSTVVEL